VNLRRQRSPAAEAASVWPPLPPDWSLAAGHVDCVRVRLDDLPPLPRDLARGVLSDTDLDHVERIVAPGEQRRVLIGRAAARILLGRAMALYPARVPIERAAGGKPFVASGPAFNLSHGGGMVLLAFSDEFPVGIDVEPAASGAAWSEVAPRLHPAEHAAVRGASDPAAAFVRIWTRKEAVAKAYGFGFSIDPSQWAVDPGPDILVPPPVATTLSVHDLAVGPDHVAAVAVVGQARPRYWDFMLPTAEREPPARRPIVG
jgi:4'-phosphopantetheinyl transferase